jgi:type III pantothenate kinase
MEVSPQEKNKLINLVVDCGNTRIKFGVFENHLWIKTLSCQPDEWQISLQELVSEFRPTKGIISSVRNIDELFVSALNDELSLLHLNKQTPVPIGLAYETPETLGSDRLADAIGGWVLGKNQNCLVVDFGTCITYNLVVANQFVGGAISPGMNMRYKALHAYTDGLPLVDFHDVFESIGKNTVQSIRSGVQSAILCEVDGMLQKICSENSISNVYITGGDSAFFEKGLKTPTFANPWLTLFGLNEILLYNIAS